MKNGELDKHSQGLQTSCLWPRWIIRVEAVRAWISIAKTFTQYVNYCNCIWVLLRISQSSSIFNHFQFFKITTVQLIMTKFKLWYNSSNNGKDWRKLEALLKSSWWGKAQRKCQGHISQVMAKHCNFWCSVTEKKSTMNEAAYFVTSIGFWRMNSTPEN
jgi:hypothetical protein